MGQYLEALAKDLDNLSKKLDELEKVIKKNGAKAPEAAALRDKIAPFLTKASIEKRIALAGKMDADAMGKRIKDCGLPW